MSTSDISEKYECLWAGSFGSCHTFIYEKDENTAISQYLGPKSTYKTIGNFTEEVGRAAKQLSENYEVKSINILKDNPKHTCWEGHVEYSIRENEPNV